MSGQFRDQLIAGALLALAGASPGTACEPGSGIERVIEIAPGARIGAATGYPAAPLKDKEVILTFDDGPNPAVTPQVLDLLASLCLKATFFPIGANAKDHPDLVKRELAEGHSVGGHTFSHADLSETPLAAAQKEIRDGFAPLTAAGVTPSFLRLPELRASKEVLAWVKSEGLAVIGVDIDGADWKGDPPDEELARIDAELAKHRRGIIIMHDSQPNTLRYLPHLLHELSAEGYRIVAMRPAARS